MKTIWCFGDSNTEDYNLDFDWSKKYVEWKGYVPQHWTKLLSEKMNLSIMNYGKNGSDNYTIMDSIISQIDNIKENDIIIVNWSSPIRYRVSDNDKFKSIIVEGIDNSIENISEITLKELAINRASKVWIDEVIGWMKLLNKTFNNNKIIFWAPFMEFNNVKGVLKIAQLRTKLSIHTETEGVINDYHMGELGCKEFCEIIYNYLNKKNIL